jgi:pyruvate-formate lyase
VLRRVADEFGLPPHAPCHVVRSLHFVDGRRIAASPDGRRAGEPVGDSLGPVTGTAEAGPLGVLNSVLRIDAARHYPGGYNLNLTLPAEGARPELISAQADPERHRDLVVRVAGFSARFVELSALEQAALIERAEAAA